MCLEFLVQIPLGKNHPKNGFFLYSEKFYHWFLLETYLNKNWYYWLNGLLFRIHDEVLNFHGWTLCYHELFHDNRKKYLPMDLSMDICNIPIIWKLSYVKLLRIIVFDLFEHYVDCIPFSCIDSFHMAHNQAKYFKKTLFSNLW